MSWRGFKISAQLRLHSTLLKTFDMGSITLIWLSSLCVIQAQCYKLDILQPLMHSWKYHL